MPYTSMINVTSMGFIRRNWKESKFTCSLLMMYKLQLHLHSSLVEIE